MMAECNIKGHASYLVLLFILTFQTTSGGHVLFVVFPAYSFVPPLVSVAESLMKYGHQSTFVLSDSLAQTPILKNKNINVIISEGMSKFQLKHRINAYAQAAFRGEKLLNFKLMGYLSELCELVLQDEKLFADLKKYEFDIAVISKHYMAMCFNIVAYKLSLPFVHCGVIYDAINDRIPHLPSFVSDMFFLGYSDNMTFVQRFLNSLFFIYRQFSPDLISPKNAVAKYAPEKPFITTTELWLQTSFHLIDSDILLDYSKPVFPNYAFVAGLGVDYAVKELPNDFADFMEKADTGVVVVSFGTILETFSDKILNKLMKTFRILHDQHFIISLSEKYQLRMANVFQKSWIPQKDLLAHPKTKVFITHCGHNSQVEAVYHGVPMIGFPVILDQPYNALRMESKGYGIMMDINSFTAEELISNIKTILGNPKYREAVKKASAIFKNREKLPQDIAAYWVDHVIQYGGDYMRPGSVDIPLFKYYLLDIICTWVLAAFLVCFITCLGFRKILKSYRFLKVKVE